MNIAGKTLKPLTDFRWSTVRVYMQSEHAQGRDAGVSAVFAFAALALTDSIDEEIALHDDMDALHKATIRAGVELTSEEAGEVSAYIDKILGLTEAAQVDTPEGKL